MPLDNPRGGIGYAPEFQSSALPWVTSSVAPATGNPVRFNLPKVTRFLAVTNLGTGTNTLSFGFTWNGIVNSSNKFIVPAGQTVLLEVRCKLLYLQGESGTPPYNLFAGLTTVDPNAMPLLTGSAPDGSSWPGVG